MFGSFSRSALAAVGRAQDGALTRGAAEIDATDVVVAVLSSLRGTIEPTLAALGAALATHTDLDPVALPEPDPTRSARLRPPEFPDRIPDQRLPFAESAIASFRGAWKKPKWDGRTAVDEYDLLTAAMEQPALAQACGKAGIDLDAVRSAIDGQRQSAPT